ncbi:hypothetical protein ACQPYH_35460 [Kribbella sp. CA-245084]|uniref:hypothetical protein n=1 Tax=Kribbella sp. CA-245084 TaxID=3239940 RepID=UPI003D8C0911
MDEQMRIPISTLKRSAKVLLEHVEQLEGESVAVDKDYFWAISAEQLYGVVHEPSDFTIGQLSECLEWIEAIVAEPDNATSYGLVWLAELI